jgi:hypothetical protein
VVLSANAGPAVERALARAGYEVRPVRFTPFDAAAAGAIRHFETYNRGAASQRVADVVRALLAEPGAALVAAGDAALASLLASAVVPVRRAVLDVQGFDTESDAAFLEHLDIPGLRRAGDLRTAAALARGELVVHGAGGRFRVPGLEARAETLSPPAIVAELARAERPLRSSSWSGSRARGAAAH